LIESVGEEEKVVETKGGIEEGEGGSGVGGVRAE